MCADKGWPPLKKQWWFWSYWYFLPLGNIILVGFCKLLAQNFKAYVQAIFFHYQNPVCKHDSDVKIRDYLFARFLENNLWITSPGYLMVQIIFQNFVIQFLSTTMKFPKKNQFWKWSKQFKRYWKLNDKSPGYWEKYFGVSEIFQRHFKIWKFF